MTPLDRSQLADCSAGPGETVKSSPAVAGGVLYVNAGNVYAFDLK
ncbi:MAG: PQQ-binding-like beta-propeller repeat protein [Streptosporangiaceae bacterium]